MNINIQEFRGWLGEEPPPSLESWRNEPEKNCPLAQWLRSKGAESPRVWALDYRLGPVTSRDHREMNLPPWAGNFIEWLDLDPENASEADRLAMAVVALEKAVTVGSKPRTKNAEREWKEVEGE